MLRRNNSNHRRKFSSINITPFVDVVLVLLIIFMITAPNMERGIKLKLPKILAGTVSTEDTPLILNITKNNELFIEDTKVPLKNLDYRIKLLLRSKKDKAIFLRADKDTKYGFVAKIINNIKKAGINKIALITEAPDKKESSLPKNKKKEKG